MKKLTTEYVRNEYNKQNVDRYKNRYEFYRWFNKKGSQESYKMHLLSLSHYTKNIKFHNYLEIGPGPGTWTKLFLNNTAKFALIDISEEMIKQAIKSLGKRDNVRYVVKDFEKFNEKDKYDFVIGIRTIKYMPHKDKVFLNIYNAMKKRGKCIVINQSADTILQIMGRLFSRKQKNLLHSGNLPVKKIILMLKETGFKSIKVYPSVIKIGVPGLFTIYSLSWFLFKIFYKRELNWFSRLISGAYLIKFEK